MVGRGFNRKHHLSIKTNYSQIYAQWKTICRNHNTMEVCIDTLCIPVKYVMSWREKRKKKKKKERQREEV